MPRIGLVLPGGGARGAYEAGALSVLLPAIEARGEKVTLLCGTSVGAINAAQLGSVAELPAGEQASALLARWRAMRKRDVISPVVGVGTASGLVRLAGEALGLPRMRAASLLDPAPLAGSLEQWIDWTALHRNVRTGVVDAVCVVATSLDRGTPVGFVETRSAPPESTESVRYVRARLAGEHVRASAAIPLLFPSVAVERPRAAAGHYVDGGTRLNTPIAPALALGADRIAVIGFEPLAGAPLPRVAHGGPRLADVAASVLDGLLVDQVAQDVRRMLAVNAFFVEDAARGLSPTARAYRVARGRAPYRRISYAFVAPERRGAVGALAERVFRERYGGRRALRSPDFALLARLAGGAGAAARGELLSFLLFDEVFVEELIAMGRADARRWLRRNPGVWATDGVGAGLAEPPPMAETTALDEYRALRRR